MIRGEVCKDIICKYNLTPKYKGRVDFAGNREDPKLWIASVPFDITTEVILSEIEQLLNGNIQFPVISQLIDFLNEQSPSPPISLCSEINGARANLRNVMFSK